MLFQISVLLNRGVRVATKIARVIAWRARCNEDRAH